MTSGRKLSSEIIHDILEMAVRTDEAGNPALTSSEIAKKFDLANRTVGSALRRVLCTVYTQRRELLKENERLSKLLAQSDHTN